MKELWVKRYALVMHVPVIHGVGGSFDVMAGAIPRAPLWMQRNGLEWFFRLLQEPGRMWQRYLVTNSLFIPLFLVEWVRKDLCDLVRSQGVRNASTPSFIIICPT